MISPSSENLLLRKTRWLTQALILSGTLNIGLLATFVYFVIQEKQESLAFELKPLNTKPSVLQTNIQLLRAYSFLPYHELLLRLENKELIENGLYKRDLALSCLIAFHHFNFDKALNGHSVQKRTFSFTNAEGEEKIELPVYPGLTDDQFQALLRYAKTEKWPLTPQGLFYELKRSSVPRDPSLIETFCFCFEYETIHTLFLKTGLSLSSNCLIDFLCEIDWNMISDFTQKQRQALDLSLERRRAFLLDCVRYHSKIAVKLLIETDLEYVLKRCEDACILTLLDIYRENLSCLEHFAKALLASPRTDNVWKRAAEILYDLAKEIMPEPYDHFIVLQRFCPKTSSSDSSKEKELSLKPNIDAEKNTQKKIYTVENGDNLWKISRKFHVPIKEIMKANHLETEKLRPGKQLEIPIKNSSNS